jgi:plasmid stability protein
MAQFTVRKLEDDVKQRLKARAAAHGVSMEEEVRRVLRQAVMAQLPQAQALGSRMASRFAKLGLRDHEGIHELRGATARGALFEP